MTDAQGNSTTGTILVDIVDDVPTAHVDSGNVTEGELLAVAASGVLSNDVAGADGFTFDGGVVGVRAAGNDLTTDVTAGVDTPIPGLHGTLHLRPNGGYTTVDSEQHHGGHHRRVRLHGQGRRRRPVDDDADDQPCQRDGDGDGH